MGHGGDAPVASAAQKAAPAVDQILAVDMRGSMAAGGMACRVSGAGTPVRSGSGGSDTAMMDDTLEGSWDWWAKRLTLEADTVIGQALTAQGRDLELSWKAVRSHFLRFSVGRRAHDLALVDSEVRRNAPATIMVKERVFAGEWWCASHQTWDICAEVAHLHGLTVTRSRLAASLSPVCSSGRSIVRRMRHFSALLPCLWEHRARSRPGAQPSALLIVHAPTSAHVAGQIAKALRSRGLLRPTILRCGPLSRHVPFPTPFGFASPEQRIRALGIGLRASAQAQRAMHHSLNGRRLSPVLSSRFDILTSRLVLEVMAYLDPFRRLLARERPVVALLLNADYISNAFALAAMQEGIPCAYMPHGIMDEGFYDGVEYDTYLAWGPAQVQVFRRILADADVHVTGCPLYDDLIGSQEAPDLPPPGTVCLVTEAWPSLPAWLEDFVASASTQPEIQLEVAVHPLEEKHHIDRLKRIGGARVRFTSGRPVSEAIARNRVFVAQGSTAALEALVLPRPVVLVQPPAASPVQSLVDGRYVVCAADAADAVVVVRRMANGNFPASARPRALESLVGPLDGRAADRAAEALEEISGAGRQRR